MLLASAGNLLRWNAANALAAPAVFAIVNSAIPQAAASVASGELITLYGVGLGPAVGTLRRRCSTSRAIRSTSRRHSSALTVRPPLGPRFHRRFWSLRPQTAGSIGVFGVLNEDGSVNSASNPAADGSIVVLYLTGLGAPFEGAQSGAVSPAASSDFQYGIDVKWATESLNVLYAGTAPDLINGLDQVNVRLPMDVTNPQVTVQIAGAGSVGQASGLTLSSGAPVTGTVMVYAK